MLSNSVKRIQGLDTLRALAIILVFMFHYPRYSSGNFPFGLIGNIGWTGVNLFFVLSGYLIGNQIFSSLAKHGGLPLKQFYCRRLMRTLPNYLLVLLLYFSIPGFSGEPLLSPLWKFLTFTQNFGLQTSAFSHAWSLCLEEQFYLILPLIALLLPRRLGKRITIYFILSAIFLGIAIRTLLWFHFIYHNQLNTMPATYAAHIYYPSYTRLDGLLFGVTLALIRNYFQKTWDRIIERGNYFLIAGFFICVITFYMFRSFSNLLDLIPTAIGYPLQDLGFACFVIAALSSKSYLNKIRIPGASTIATLSYAIYLTHKAAIHLTDLELLKFGINQFSFFAIILTIIASLLAGYVLYFCIESPFLKLRDKYWPKATYSKDKKHDLLYRAVSQIRDPLKSDRPLGEIKPLAPSETL